MKKIFSTIAIALCIAFTSCKTGQDVVQTDNPNSFGVSATASSVSKPDTLDAMKIDSLVRVDRLPVINKWTSSIYVDDENNRAYTYRTLYDRSTNIIYTLKALSDGRFVLIKRTIKTR